MLHAHSKDAAQEGFYKACKTANANHHLGAHYPHKRKLWRTTVWKPSAIRFSFVLSALSIPRPWLAMSKKLLGFSPNRVS